MESKAVVGKHKCITRIPMDTVEFDWSIPNFDSLQKVGKQSLELSHCFASSSNPDIAWKLKIFPVPRLHAMFMSVVPFELSMDKNEHKGEFDIVLIVKSSQNTLINQRCSIKPGQELTFFEVKQERVKRILVAGALNLQCKVLVIFPTKTSAEKVVRRNEAEFIKEPFSLQGLLHNRLLSDCMVKVGEETVQCHKNILAFFSPVFRSMFLHPTTEAETGVVTVTDNSVTAVRGLLEFMYTGKVENLNEKAEELLVIAEKYDVLNLKIICEESLIGNLSFDNVCRLLVLADLHSAANLKNSCFDFVCENRKRVVKLISWEDLKLFAPNLATDALEWTI